MTTRERRAMAVCGLLGAMVLTAATQAQYWYAKSHHLLTGPLATDDISQWWTEHAGWLMTLVLGAVGGCLLYFVVWTVRQLVAQRNER